MNNENLRIYEINTASWLTKLSVKYETAINLGNIPLNEWNSIIGLDFNAIWLMGIWQRSDLAIDINLADEAFMSEMSSILDNFNPRNDLIGSAYSVRDYAVNEKFGDKEDVIKIKKLLNESGIKLILDYVPNHVAPDHKWAKDHPEYFIQGSIEEANNDPKAYLNIDGNVYANGRDPYLEPWNDVIQLNAFNEEYRKASVELLLSIAPMCDGVRCDMAMLMLSSIFISTWKSKLNEESHEEYWLQVIPRVKEEYPDFIFIAESYWNCERELISNGFDICYDKDFYDHLLARDVHLLGLDINKDIHDLNQTLRFLENHDEPRIATALPYELLKIALIVFAATPGSKLFFDGQLEGMKIRTPVQLNRDPASQTDEYLAHYYRRFLFLINNIELVSLDYLVVRFYDDSLNNRLLSWAYTSSKQGYLFLTNWSSDMIQLNMATLDIANLLDNKKIDCIFTTNEDNRYVETLSLETDISIEPYEGLILSISS